MHVSATEHGKGHVARPEVAWTSLADVLFGAGVSRRSIAEGAYVYLSEVGGVEQSLA